MRHSATSTKCPHGSVSVIVTQNLKAVKLISFSHQFICSLSIPKIFVDCLQCARLWSGYFESNNKQSSPCSPRAWNWGVEGRKEKGREKVINNPTDLWRHLPGDDVILLKGRIVKDTKCHWTLSNGDSKCLCPSPLPTNGQMYQLRRLSQEEF